MSHKSIIPFVTSLKWLSKLDHHSWLRPNTPSFMNEAPTVQGLGLVSLQQGPRSIIDYPCYFGRGLHNTFNRCPKITRAECKLSIEVFLFWWYLCRIVKHIPLSGRHTYTPEVNFPYAKVRKNWCTDNR